MDDLTLPDGSIIALNEIGGVLYQRVKPTWGAAGVATDTDTSAPLPVQFRDADGTQTNASVIGSTSGAKVITDAAGTLQQYLRGLVTLWITGTLLKPVYAASATVAITLASLASSSTFVAGRESTVIDNTGNLYIDAILAGKITVGTSPGLNTQILVYLFAIQNDTPTYPDTMTGADAARTLTSVGVGAGFLRLASVINVDATTSDRSYPFMCPSVAKVFDGVYPPKYGMYVTENTGAALNATGSNHVVKITGINYRHI